MFGVTAVPKSLEPAVCTSVAKLSAVIPVLVVTE